ncbi:uncharacterized protein LOC103524116 [Trichonephila clavipes]|nr:uncharacterized protein LOC103524116 [Trichonephila clavipes]
MAFRAISTTPGLNIAIFIDSQAAIKTVSGYNLFPSKLEFECKQLINSFLCTGREVVLQWIPSHCGIHGNEQADKLAKRGLDTASTLPSDASSKRQATQGQIVTSENFHSRLLANLGLLCSMAKDVLSVLPYQMDILREKRKGRPASFQAKKCLIPDDVLLASVENHMPEMVSNYRR